MSFRVRDAQGGYRWFLSRAELLRASDGTLLQWMGANLDIEELCAQSKHLGRAKRSSATTPKVPPTGFGNRPACKFTLLTENAFGSRPADRLLGHGATELRSVRGSLCGDSQLAGKKLLSIT